ncbi:hypothetical protein EIN_294280 [Entamoeba invadens IP1]|uniref:Uncharacterized protein n=1 Tax=Entamoeba invadens IP1 TaxID=370355 RepID=L7FMD7_ENTIV|nr:hypothetical protein EIN_294280 [Entamoeba invadens IP1]ELP90968.1 hypothetical protein EIN_294280 [Entamoeba invadens IP1]|eukprot:XP_004257739.1 hypothetical protein EIN_294280 [Entamoeba invadens IP1]
MVCVLLFVLITLSFGQPGTPDKPKHAKEKDEQHFPEMKSLEQTLPTVQQPQTQQPGIHRLNPETAPFVPRQQNLPSQHEIVQQHPQQRYTYYYHPKQPTQQQYYYYPRPFQQPLYPTQHFPHFVHPQQLAQQQYEQLGARPRVVQYTPQQQAVEHPQVPQVHPPQHVVEHPKIQQIRSGQRETTPIPFRPNIVIFEKFEMCENYQKQYSIVNNFAIVRFWPGEVCRTKVCAIPKKTPRVREEFLLHGFWPQIQANKELTCCEFKFPIERTEHLIFKDPKTTNLILRNWVSVEKCGLSISQFDQHGTCAMSNYNNKKGIFEYTRTAILLYKKYDVWKILKESELKVEPNKLYNIEDIKRVVENACGAEPIFTCINSYSVHEMKLCYDMRTNRINPHPVKCLDKNYREEKNSCGNQIMFAPFPEYLLNPETAPRNNCEY